MADTIKISHVSDDIPFAIEVMKQAIGIDHNSYDQFLPYLVRGAIELIEKVTGQCLTKQNLRTDFEYDESSFYSIPFYPYVSLTTVKGIDDDGTEHTLTVNTDYYLTGTNRPVIEVFSYYNKLLITYIAGYTNATCPPALIQAVWKQVAFDSQNKSGGNLTEEVLQMIQPFIKY